MTRILAILFLALLLTATTTAAKTLNKVAAIVNDEIITTYQLDKAVVAALAKIANQNQLTAAEFDNIKTQAMQKLVNDKLLQQRIKELDIKVFAAEIESAVEDVQRRNNLSREMLEEALVTQGMSMAKYKQQIEDDILRHRLLGQEVKYKVMVTSRDVRSYFDQHRDEYDTEPKVRLNRLTFVVPTGSEEELAAFRKRVDVSRDLLLTGEEFNTVLASHGDAASGGGMGMVADADLAEPIRLALVGVAAGGVSEPVDMNGKLHLFHVAERTAIDGDPFDFYKADIEAQLRQEKTDARFKEWQRELRGDAYVEVKI